MAIQSDRTNRVTHKCHTDRIAGFEYLATNHM